MLDFTHGDDTAPPTGNDGETAPGEAAGEPSPLSLHDLAVLIRELFGEGSLSWDQLCALADLPDLAPLLSEAVAGAPAARRPLAAE